MSLHALTYHQIAPTHPREEATESSSSYVKDNAYISVYNDGDITDLLFKEPAFASGYLVLEGETPKPAAAIEVPKRRPAAHFNTGTTPPPKSVEEAHVSEPTTPFLKSAMKPAAPTEVVEHTTKAVEVSPPTEHKEEHHHHKHHAHTHSQESEEEHVMDWWPENEATAQHVWVEKDQVSADEEEDVFEEEIWSETFYD